MCISICRVTVSLTKQNTNLPQKPNTAVHSYIPQQDIKISFPHPNGFRGPSSPEQFKAHSIDGTLTVRVEHTTKGKRVAKLTLQKAEAENLPCSRRNDRAKATWLANKAIREKDRSEARVEASSKELADKTEEEE